MITVKAYLVPNTAEVQIFDTSIFTVRNRVVYSRPIKVYQGIDNPIQVIIRNQDQKSVDLTGYTASAQIQDPASQTTIRSYNISFTSTGSDITKGLGTFIIPAADINQLENRIYKLTFSTTFVADSQEQPLYIDDNYRVPLDLQVLPGYYSNYAPNPSFDYEVIDGGTL
jgi:hypothetical protein